MILMDFLALILLYAVHRLIGPKSEDFSGNVLFLILGAFGIMFLFIDMIDKIASLF